MNNTQLNDGILWFDGVRSISSLTTLMGLLAKGAAPNKLHLDSSDVAQLSEVISYNALVSKSDRIQVGPRDPSVSIDWNIPPEFLDLDVKDYLITKLNDNVDDFSYSNAEISTRVKRILLELRIFEDKGLLSVLKAIIFIINTLEENNIVWGVGRGSSVASYVLYLIGAHDVDSFKYNLNISDFISY